MRIVRYHAITMTMITANTDPTIIGTTSSSGGISGCIVVSSKIDRKVFDNFQT